MIAIHTKYLAPTKFRGERIKAYTSVGHSVIIPFPNSDAMRGVDRHFEAVKALAAKYKLYPSDISDMRYVYSADGKGLTFCFDRSKIN